MSLNHKVAGASGGCEQTNMTKHGGGGGEANHCSQNNALPPPPMLCLLRTFRHPCKVVVSALFKILSLILLKKQYLC